MRIILFTLFLVTAASMSMASSDIPTFEDCPAVVETINKPARVILTKDSRGFATRIKRAAGEPINFAGRFIFGTWGCGAGCIMGTVIDAKTGAVTMLPFMVSNWPLEVTEPLSFRKDSCLLVIQGSRNEKGQGKYYYKFESNNFKLVHANEEK
jgi:hypothetical protein